MYKKALFCACVIITIFMVSSHLYASGLISNRLTWITLHYDGEGYENAKSAVENYFETAFRVIEETKSKNREEIPIAIGFYDLDHDGTPEIIAFISDTEFCGANDSGGLFVFTYNGKVIMAEREIAGFPLNTSTINNPESHQIGIIRNIHGWDNLYINISDKINLNNKRKVVWETEPYTVY